MSFDRITPFYDLLARLIFGRVLQQAQTNFLEDIAPGAAVLIVGGGTGWLLGPVLKVGQPGRIVYLEASARMLARASRRMLRGGPAGSVEFRVGDETALQPGESFDALITPFLLDLFTESTLSARLLPRLRAALKPGGHWLVTDFVRTDVWWQKILLWTMIRFFRLTAGIETRHLADWQRLLSEAGCVRQKRQPHLSGLVSAERWMRP